MREWSPLARGVRTTSPAKRDSVPRAEYAVAPTRVKKLTGLGPDPYIPDVPEGQVTLETVHSVERDRVSVPGSWSPAFRDLDGAGGRRAVRARRRSYSSGGHTYEYWNEHTVDALTFLSSRLT